MLYRPEELGGVPVEALVTALRAEGCAVEQSAGARLLDEHPLFEGPSPPFPLLPGDWPLPPRPVPRAEHLHRHSLRLTVPDQQRWADVCVDAFEKVISHRRFLLEGS